MTEKEMAKKILNVVSGQGSVKILTALTMATGVIVKACVKKDQLEEFAESFKQGIIAAVVEWQM